MNIRMTTTMMLLASLAACGPRPEDDSGKVSDTGRKETRAIEAAGNVYGGNEGTQVRKKVDKALDTNDQRIDQLNQELEKQEQ